MLISQKQMVHCGNTLLFWLVLNTFITDSIGLSLTLSVSMIAALLYIRIPPVPKDKISPAILNLFKIDQNNEKGNLIFHKAGGFHAPENTLEAVQQAIDLEIPAIEIDLDFTKDGVGVLIHGPKVDDTTDGQGLVSEFTFEQIQALNASFNDVNKDKYPVARVPTLEACVELCIKNKIVIFIDCKSSPSLTAKLITDLYKKHPELYELGIVCSFYPTIIYSVRQADNNILTALTHRDFLLTLEGDGTERNKEIWKRLISPVLDAILSWAHWSILWFICGNSFFLCNKDKICQESKNFWESLGVRLVAWTVNDQIEKEFLIKHLGIPVITDGLVHPHSRNNS
ncbi:unnamed protein product [Candidula unifasciata]|uniref:GP-PDE domain-containing protein n=1 Tax=Candidula unifasciata TaxID=100452 RepID=A0A8S3YLZ2_9EUPU|nr:unnamed protein product [Candidula unifasciata]